MVTHHPGVGEHRKDEQVEVNEMNHCECFQTKIGRRMTIFVRAVAIAMLSSTLWVRQFGVLFVTSVGYPCSE